jgi:hypothetical protein
MDCALIVLLYARHRLTATARIVRRITTDAGVGRVLLVVNHGAVDTADVQRAFRRVQHAEIVEHDNSGQEFGGYQAAIDRMRGDIPERMIVMNDTAGSHGILTPIYIGGFLARLSQGFRRMAMGTIDWHPRVLELHGLRSSRWIRTHFFAIDREALQALGNRLHQPGVDALITASPDPAIFFGDEIKGALREHLEHFLLTPTPESWYRAAPLSPSNCMMMAGKARAILQEKYLSMALEAADIAICQVHMGRGDRMRDQGQKLAITLQRLVQKAWLK